MMIIIIYIYYTELKKLQNFNNDGYTEIDILNKEFFTIRKITSLQIPSSKYINNIIQNRSSAVHIIKLPTER